MKRDRCRWGDCDAVKLSLSIYCADHHERARRNVLLALGAAAPRSLMWRPGDEVWLADEAMRAKR